MKKHLRKFSRPAFFALIATGSTLLAGGLPAQATNSQSGLPNGCYLEEFPRMTSQATQSLDLLFVADTSASLDDDKAKIAAGIDAFVAGLPSSVDYQIAVMPAHGSRGSHSGALYSYRNNPIVLSSKTLSVASIRKYLHENLINAPQDIWADGGEEGLYSLYHSMDQGKIDAIRAKGFFRKNAALAVVFISDENDICARYPAGVQRVPDPEGYEIPAFKRDCANVDQNTVYSRLLNLQNGRPLIVSGVVYNDLKTVPVGKGQDEYGYGYMDLIQIAGGVSVDIAKGDYSHGLAQIAQYSAQKMAPTVDFRLGHSPVDPGSIVVTLRNPSTSSNSGADNDDDHDGHHYGHDDDRDHDHDFNDDHGHDHGGTCSRDDDRSSSSTSSQGSSRTVDFTFNNSTNIVHILDESAPEPLADIQYCLASATPAPSPSPSVIAVPSPSVTVDPTPSPSVSATPSPSPSPSPSETVTPSPTPSVTVDPTPSPTVTVDPSPAPSATVAPTPIPSPTVSVTPDPTPSVTVTPDPSPSASATPAPTATVSADPTPGPTSSVTPAPSPSPSVTVTPAPSPSASPTCSGPFCGSVTGT
jgi:hypothetical protein